MSNIEDTYKIYTYFYIYKYVLIIITLVLNSRYTYLLG